MAPNTRVEKPGKLNKKPANPSWNVHKYVQKYCNVESLQNFLTNARYIMPIGWCLIAIEFILNVMIVERVPYTEIDWNAYMQECEGFLNGTWNYTNLKGLCCTNSGM